MCRDCCEVVVAGIYDWRNYKGSKTIMLLSSIVLRI